MKLFLILLTLSFISCQKENENTGDQVIMNQAYGTDAAQRMDIYLPAGRNSSDTKVIILIHGGAWATGDKSDFDLYVDSLKKRLPGYAIFNINYRLSINGTNVFPAQENDVNAAVEYIYSKRSEYRISDKFVYLGASAGAHLALLQGYKHVTTIKPKAIVDFFGPVDLINLYNNPPSPLITQAEIATIIGATPTSNPTLYQQSSPSTFVNATAPPTIILQGGLDPLVSPSQSQALNNTLQNLGVIHQYVYYPMEGHGWFGITLSDSFNKIQAFLEANVN